VLKPGNLGRFLWLFRRGDINFQRHALSSCWHSWSVNFGMAKIVTAWIKTSLGITICDRWA
jgi:hypothetical protein